MFDGLFFAASFVSSLLCFWLKIGLLLTAFLFSSVLQFIFGNRQLFRSEEFHQILENIKEEASELAEKAHSTPSRQLSSETGAEGSSESTPKDNFAFHAACKCPFKCVGKSQCKCHCAIVPKALQKVGLLCSKCQSNVKPEAKVESAPNSDSDKKLPQKIEISTSGLCNEEKTASSIGVYFGPSHGLNFGASLPGPQHSTMRAEIEAVYWALQVLREWNFDSGQQIVIRTNNETLIRSMKDKNFAGYSSSESRTLRKLAKLFPTGITFEHVNTNCKKNEDEEALKLALSELQTTIKIEKIPQCSSAEEASQMNPVS